MNSSDFRKEAREKLNGKWGTTVGFTLAYMLVFLLFGLITGICPENTRSLVQILFLIAELPLVYGFIHALLKLYNGEEVHAFSFVSLGFDSFGKAWAVSFRMILKVLPAILLVVVSYILIGYSMFAFAINTVTSNSTTSLYNGSSSSRAASDGARTAEEAAEDFVESYTGTYSSLDDSADILSALGISSINKTDVPTTFSKSGAICLILGLVLLIASYIWLFVRSLYFQLSYLISMENPDITAKEAVEKSKELMTGKRAKLFVLNLSFIGWAILAAFTFGIGYLWLLPYMQFAIMAFYKNSLGDTVEVIKSSTTTAKKTVVVKPEEDSSIVSSEKEDSSKDSNEN